MHESANREPPVSSARLEDLPGYQEMAASEAFQQAKERWTVEQGSFESRQDADEAKQRHLDEQAEGEQT